MKTLLLSLTDAAVLAGSWDEGRARVWDRDRSVLGPIPLMTLIAYVDSALDRVTFVDLLNDSPVISRTSVGRNAIYAQPSPDRHHLFVITRGEEAVHTGEIDQPPMLWSIDAQHVDAAAQGYTIGSPFDRIALAPDNSIALAYISAAGPAAAGYFRNPNELALVDLTQPPRAANPTLR